MVDSNYFKVGFTASESAEDRRAALQTGNPRRLVLLGMIPDGSIQDEQYIHSQLWEYKTDGGDEWFDIPPGMQESITRLLNDYQQSQDHSGSVIRSSPFDVRPLRRGQLDHTPTRGENVSNPGKDFGVARRQSFLTLMLRK
jgi:hypothetical protein